MLVDFVTRQIDHASFPASFLQQVELSNVYFSEPTQNSSHIVQTDPSAVAVGFS